MNQQRTKLRFWRCSTGSGIFHGAGGLAHAWNFSAGPDMRREVVPIGLPRKGRIFLPAAQTTAQGPRFTMAKSLKSWCRIPDSNWGPSVYKTCTPKAICTRCGFENVVNSMICWLCWTAQPAPIALGERSRTDTRGGTTKVIGK